MVQKKNHAKSASARQNAKQNSSSKLSFVLWGMAFLIVLILFVLFLPKMNATMTETGFWKRVGINPPRTESTVAVLGENSGGEKTDAPAAVVIEQTPVITIRETPRRAEPEPSEAVSETQTQAQPQTAQTSAARSNAQPGRVQLKVFFVQIQSDGSVSRKEVTRDIPANDSPLTSAINELLGGPTVSEHSKGCDTLIPPGVRLLSATVENRVAKLNFSDEFQFNSIGVEGFWGQLEQIVYTATAFPTVDSVQFLIEGETRGFIGEGVWIGSPISRGTFR